MNVDYRLLHHFRVSQRRELALRGGLPARFGRDGLAAPGSGSDEALRAPRTARPAPPGSVVQLLAEDR